MPISRRMNAFLWGFPGDSDSIESACNEGVIEDTGSIPGSGRSPGRGHVNLLQYSWIFLVVQLVKNLPSMQETRLRSLGLEDTLEKGKATHSSILTWRIPWTTAHGVTKSRTRLSNFHFHLFCHRDPSLFSRNPTL